MTHKILISFYLFLLCNLCLGQPGQNRQHWYFGQSASIHFKPTGIVLNSSSPFRRGQLVAPGYFKNGKLALLTDGLEIYDANGVLKTVLPNGGGVNVKVIPHTQNDSMFYIFVINGTGTLKWCIYHAYGHVLVKGWSVLDNNLGGGVQIIKHCFAQGWWIIATERGGNNIGVFYLQNNTVKLGEKYTSSIPNPSHNINISTHPNGTQLLIAGRYDPGSILYSKFVSYNFDPSCGKLSSPQLVAKSGELSSDVLRAKASEFSPNGQFVYLLYNGNDNSNRPKSLIVQHLSSDLSNSTIIAKSDEYFGDISLASNEKIYITRAPKGAYGRSLDVINIPNNKGAACSFGSNELILPLSSHFTPSSRFPPFIDAFTSNYCKNKSLDFNQGYTGLPCLGNTLHFFVDYPLESYSSHEWVVDYNGRKSRFKKKAIDISLPEAGLIKVFLIKQFCKFYDTIPYEFQLESIPFLFLPEDSVVCQGDQIELAVLTNAEKILWSTGDTSLSLLVGKGKYSVSVYNGVCSATDTIKILEHAPLSILLDSDYYICRKENKLAKLDAGKGFINYLWFPTGDTSQWIVVKEMGSYFVVVNDFHGCQGNQGAFVEERCDLVYHVPTAFTPNGDGINDLFRPRGNDIIQTRMQIYNRWGELIYRGDNVSGWNGFGAPEGVYHFIMTIYGFKNENAVMYNESGNVTLLR